ncbi:MAG: hypothetical protein HY746_04700 [Elusimicrobia bacterium]|nr:hypothetical protein [Elusimicrobiota bacterium]
MTKIRSILGYLWAMLATPIVILSLATSDNLGRLLVKSTGIKIAPFFTGGEIACTIDHGTYKTHIHESVTFGIIKNMGESSIQVYFEPAAALPEIIREELDLPDVSSGKFFIILDTRTGNVEYENKPDTVTDFKASKFKNGWAVRIKIEVRNQKTEAR